jgi:hypothetical protein
MTERLSVLLSPSETRVDIRRRVEDAVAAVPAAGMTAGELLRLLRPIVPSVGDGHTPHYDPSDPDDPAIGARFRPAVERAWQRLAAMDSDPNATIHLALPLPECR